MDSSESTVLLGAQRQVLLGSTPAPPHTQRSGRRSQHGACGQTQHIHNEMCRRQQSRGCDGTRGDQHQVRSVGARPCVRANSTNR